jgi:hypothetical protein
MMLVVLATARAAAPSSSCELFVDASVTPERIGGQAHGILNSINETSPPLQYMLPLKLPMWRGPMAHWLWACSPHCNCTTGNCSDPFYLYDRVKSVATRQQYILDNIHKMANGCTDPRYSKHPCPRPGGPSDPNFTKWSQTVTAVALEAKRRGADLAFDIWNEPNGCALTHPASEGCPALAKFWENVTLPNGTIAGKAELTQLFFLSWDVAVRAIRKVLPNATIVGPSAADGGPGIEGWGDLQDFLQAFLAHTHEQGTRPEVLTWHAANEALSGLVSGLFLHPSAVLDLNIY